MSDFYAIYPPAYTGNSEVTSAPGYDSIKNIYNEVTSVPQSNVTVINSYTVIDGVTSRLKSCCMSGTNIAQYEVSINNSTIDKKYTNFGTPLNVDCDFSNLLLSPGDVVEIKVIHNRPYVGDFNSRIVIGEAA